MPQLTESPVHANTANGAIFLYLHPFKQGVRVSRAKNSHLNNFWPFWLRQLILENTDPADQFAVEVAGTSVLVRSSLSSAGTVETVRHFAQQIVPLPLPPLRWRRRIGTSMSCHWDCLDGFDSTWLQTLTLPDGARVLHSGDVVEGSLTLRRNQRNPFKIGELRRMVEMHVALHASGRS